MFFTGLTVLSTLSSINLLSFLSMNYHECKVSVDGDDPVFFNFSIKASKCSGSCSHTNNPHEKLCFDIVKNLNVKAFSLMSKTNKTRHIEWHETCKWECRLNPNVCNNKQRSNDGKSR